VALIDRESWPRARARRPWRTLAAVRAKHDAEGLRYMALLDRQDHHVISEAGAALIARPLYMPGEVMRKGRRVRLVALIPPRSRDALTLSPSDARALTP
jgi:hypothetical protein